MKRGLLLTLLGAPWPTVAAPAATAEADVAPAPPDDARFRLTAGADFWNDDVSEFAVDGEGREYGFDNVGATRVRVGLATPLGAKAIQLHVEADLFADRVYGSVPSLGTDLVERPIRDAHRFNGRPILPRKLYFDWVSRAGILRVGHQTSRWGLGILAHDGARDGRLFGDAWRGSIVERLMFATSPLQALGALPHTYGGRFTLVVAGDLVFSDETADLLERDRFAKADDASQLVLSALMRPRVWKRPPDRPRHDISGGVYVVKRDQVYAEGDTLDVWVFDGHLRYLQQWDRTNAIRYELEMAWLAGETDRLITEGGPRGVDVEGFGAAFEMAWQWKLLGAPIALTGLAGVASGDGDPDDGVLQRFTFHGDYDVGLLIFDHVIPALQRRAIERIDDPLRSKDPPEGVENQAGRGGVSGASYGGVRLAVGPWRGLDGGVQFISAATSAPLIDPFLSFQNGGVPTNAFGGDAEGSLGNEIDVALRYTARDLGADGLSPSLRLTYGVFLPGSVFEGPDGKLGTVHLLQAKLAVDFDLNGGV